MCDDGGKGSYLLNSQYVCTYDTFWKDIKKNTGEVKPKKLFYYIHPQILKLSKVKKYVELFKTDKNVLVVIDA